MYEIIKAVIQSGAFVVSDITQKINTLWVESKLTDEERQELSEMMIDYINPSTQAPELKELYLQLREELGAVKEEVSTLKTEVAELKGTEETEPGPGPETTIPKWKPWDGISTDYQAGAVVKHKGKYYKNVLEGMQNTWEPGSAGVDERYWKEITKEEAEALLKGEGE